MRPLPARRTHPLARIPPVPPALAPHLKIVFAKPLTNQDAPVYKCTAGRDRTGFATASPHPLFDTNHRAFLEVAFDDVETKWGSVDKSLAKEVGVGPAELARLRAIYLQ